MVSVACPRRNNHKHPVVQCGVGTHQPKTSANKARTRAAPRSAVPADTRRTNRTCMPMPYACGSTGSSAGSSTAGNPAFFFRRDLLDQGRVVDFQFLELSVQLLGMLPPFAPALTPPVH